MHTPMRKHAIRNAERWMEQQIEVFEKAARNLREHQQRFIETAREEEVGGDPVSSLTNHLSWFVNDAAKFTSGNLRLDLAVTAAAQLAQTEKK